MSRARALNLDRLPDSKIVAMCKILKVQFKRVGTLSIDDSELLNVAEETLKERVRFGVHILG